MNSTHQIDANNSVKVEFDTATKLWDVSIMVDDTDVLVGRFSYYSEATAAQYSVTKTLGILAPHGKA